MVLLNLIENAYKFSDPKKMIALSILRQQGKIKFSVRDQGKGLNPEQIKSVFKRYQQGSELLSRSETGCGLGLSIVQQVLIAHGSEIQVNSEVGKGSEFFFSLEIKNDS